MRKKAIVVLVIGMLVLIAFDLFSFRLISEREIDDVSPGIYCEDEYITKSDILWVIPFFENKSIAENRTWCNYILSLNKTAGMHGVYHTYEEFDVENNGEYIDIGIKEFEKCFGFKPEMFKPHQLAFDNANHEILEKSKLEYKGQLNQLLHKVYHCSDTGIFKNWFVDLF